MAYMCRVCLSSDLRLRTVQIELMSVYNRLTNVEFCSEDARPRSVCSFCYQKLLKCYTFSKMAQRSEQIFNRLLFGRAREVALRSTTELNFGSSQQFSYSPMMHIEFNDNVIHDSSHVKEEQISVKVEPISVKMEPISVKEEITVEKECLVDEPVVDASLSEEDIKNALIFEDGTEEVELNNARYHEKKETFECDSCGICFNTKIKLICHIKKKHKAVAVKLKKQSSFTSTKVDSDKMVTGISGMVCSVCNRVYNSTAKLKRHMGMHTGERPFTCSVCEMSFCLKSGLKKHKTTHTSEKPYACSTCDQTFGRRSHLIYHLRKHNGAKRYSCTVCSKSYTQSTGLVIHMRLHTGEKPYKCTECDKAFIYSTQLKRHLQLHTGVKIKIKLKKN